jgi:hypothetical protein
MFGTTPAFCIARFRTVKGATCSLICEGSTTRRRLNQLGFYDYAIHPELLAAGGDGG